MDRFVDLRAGARARGIEMGLIAKLLGRFGRGAVEDETPYRCIQCGEGYDRPQRECDMCGSTFIAATEEDASGDRRDSDSDDRE